MAEMVIAAGAAGITVHPRPDERHIRRADAIALSALLADPRYSAIEYNVEGNPTAEFLELVCRIVPHQVTLVPDSPEQSTSDHGWPLAVEQARLSPIVARLRNAGIRVSLFVDPEPDLMSLASATGAERIELYTEPYAKAFRTGNFAAGVRRYVETAAAALEVGLAINAGHDLNLDNLSAFKTAIPELAEVSIAHAITADALKFGFPAAVTAYLAALEMG
jgi:pyridoxine 5-phosphate synthase